MLASGIYLYSEQVDRGMIRIKSTNNNANLSYLSWESVILAQQSHLEIKHFAQLIKINGLWTRLSSEIGWGSALYSARNTSSFKNLLTTYKPFFMKDLHQAIATTQAPNLVVIADDLAGPNGLLIAPATLKDSLFNLYAQVSQSSLPLAFHSDGDIEDLLGIISQSGFTHVHLAGINLGKLSRLALKAHQASLIPLGGYGVATADNPELLSTIDHLRKSAGLIVADDAGLASLSQFEGYLAAVNMFK